ncbi:lysine exporter LysO family protein [Neisseria montereyensis]|uniref:Lysine exporter LysO family protein n=1 Tax=Neisseria montereyensis TaxID=2973938 RepID=A0ABT2F9E4_9NEIS|nr:lysine exporter LysO family protein [Neisseria montereyensis]MCS4532720.1 lysine exporter LysO family protein [Neisseria montereyensis]
MNSLITLVSILIPLFLGFFISIPKPYLHLIDKALSLLVYLILLLIGVSLSQVDNLHTRIDTIIGSTALLFICVIGMNLLVLMWFDRRYPWQAHGNGKKVHIGIAGSLKQLGCVAVGFLGGYALTGHWLPPENTGNYCLMLLVFLVGVQLRSSGITLRQVLVNRRGVQTAIWTTASSLAGGILFALLMPEVSWSKGLALASGFGWYSLSGIVMTEAYGPVWGSITLLNDLLREFFALVFIPILMRRYPSTAVGIGGATSLDFTLPVIQSAGGLQAVPLAISFGFIINVAAPFLMVIFSSLHF